MKKFRYGYILSLISAVLILLQVIGFKIDVPYVNEVATAILGVLVALGIVSGKDNGEDKKDSDSMNDILARNEEIYGDVDEKNKSGDDSAKQ